MGCCNSAENDAAQDTGSNEGFNDLQKDRKGEGMGAQRPKSNKGDRYAAAAGGDADDDDAIDMDAIGGDAAVTTPAAAQPDAAEERAASSTSSSSSSSSSAPPPAPAPIVRAPAARGPESLALTAAEEEAHRARVEAVHQELGAPKTMDVVFDDVPDDDMDLVDMMDRAAAGGSAVVEGASDFEAGMAIASPTKDAGVENPKKNSAARDPPLPQWFEERGVTAPKSVVWFQSGAEVTIEIAPANDDVGYALEDGDKLLYNCQDPSETDLLALSSKAAAGAAVEDIGDDDIVLYMTTMTNDRMVRDRCRLMENQLYMHNLKFAAVDVAENAFVRKKLVERSGGTDKGLPLLFVGDRFVCTYDEMQDLVDDDAFLPTLGPDIVAKASTDGGKPAPEDSAAVDPVHYRLDLWLLHPLRGAKFTVEQSTRDGAAADERMLVLRALKEEHGRYWPQLIHGPLAEVSSIPWIRKDFAREADDDSDDE
jgi:glutaredoxin-related protein